MNKPYHCCAGVIAVTQLMSLAISSASPEVFFSADTSKRQFKIVINNVDESSCWLRTNGGKDWFYTIEIWDVYGRGYRLVTKEQHEANEQGAFLGSWGDIVIEPGQKREFNVAWDNLTGDKEIMKEVRQLLSDKNPFRYSVRARLIVSFRSSDAAKDRSIYLDMISLRKEHEKLPSKAPEE